MFLPNWCEHKGLSNEVSHDLSSHTKLSETDPSSSAKVSFDGVEK